MTQRNGDTEDERRHAGDALRALGWSDAVIHKPLRSIPGL